MTGMILKDIFYMKKLKNTIFYILLLMIFLYLFGTFENNYFLYYFLAFFCLNISTLPFSYDNYSHWNEYQYALPITKKIAVCSRYLFGLCSIGVYILLQAILILVTLFLKKNTENIAELFFIQFFAVLSILLLQATIFPVLYKFGAEKGRLYMVGIVIILGSIFGFFHTMAEQIQISISIFQFFSVSSFIVLLLFLLSFLLSVKIEEKK